LVSLSQKKLAGQAVQVVKVEPSGAVRPSPQRSHTPAFKRYPCKQVAALESVFAFTLASQVYAPGPGMAPPTFPQHFPLSITVGVAPESQVAKTFDTIKDIAIKIIIFV